MENYLENYIRKLLEIKDREHYLSANDLKEIALQTGMSEQEYKAVLRAIQDYVDRGNSFATLKNWQEAIYNYQQAVTLSPFDSDILWKLASAYHELFKLQPIAKNREQALQFARQVIQINPKHLEAAEFLSKNKPLTKKSYPVLALAFLVILVAFAAFFMLAKQERSTYKAPKTQEELSKDKEENIVLDKSELEQLEDIQVEEYISKANYYYAYRKSFSYECTFYVKLGNIEVENMKLKIEVFDKNKQVVYSDMIEPTDSYDIRYLPGDVMSFKFLKFTDAETFPEINTAKISVVTFRKNKVAGTYPPFPLVPTKWNIAKSDNYNLEVAERSNRLNAIYNEPTASHHTISLAIKNTGITTIKNLKMVIVWLDAQNNILESNNLVALGIASVPLRPNDTRVIKGTWRIPYPTQQIKQYRVEILAIE